MIRYSIIIPHFDSLDTLPRAIESVPERKDIEILVIDNSATHIAANLFAQRSNVHIHYSPYGKGAGAARNVGLQHARGQWLLMLDADDFFTPNAFDAMDKYANSNADIVFFCATSCDSDTMATADRMSDTNQLVNNYMRTNEETGLRYGWCSPCAKMIKHSMVEAHAIRFEETQVANDVLFSAQIGHRAKQIAATKEIIYCATVRQGSLTLTPTLNHLNERIAVFGRFNQYLSSQGIRAPRKSIMYYVYTIARNYGYGKAINALLTSMKSGNNPFYGITRWVNTVRNTR